MNLPQALKDGATSATRIRAPLVISFVVHWVVALALTVPVAVAPLVRLASRWLFWMQVILDLGS